MAEPPIESPRTTEAAPTPATKATIDIVHGKIKGRIQRESSQAKHRNLVRPDNSKMVVLQNFDEGVSAEGSDYVLRAAITENTMPYVNFDHGEIGPDAPITTDRLYRFFDKGDNKVVVVTSVSKDWTKDPEKKAEVDRLNEEGGKPQTLSEEAVKDLEKYVENLEELEDRPAKPTAPHARIQEVPFSERKLFYNGTFQADEAELQAFLERRTEEAKEKPLYKKHLEQRDTAKAEEELERSMRYDKREVEWLKEFNGKIPADWANVWWEVRGAFEQSGEAGIQLSTILVDAGVSHAHGAVVEAAGKSQKLSTEQITKAIQNSGYWHGEEILEAQVRLGVDNDSLAEGTKVLAKRRSDRE